MILSDIGSNKQFVLKDEYEKAKHRNYYISIKLSKPSMNLFSHCNNPIENRKSEYIPRFENEKRMMSILNRLTNNTPTL
jgi:hypothetical protein